MLQDAATSAPSILGLTPLEIALVLLPLVLYGLFNLYRSQVNDKAKLVDFVSLVASVVIIGNIVSILVFKVRICIPSPCCTHVEDTGCLYTFVHAGEGLLTIEATNPRACVAPPHVVAGGSRQITSPRDAQLLLHQPP